MHVHLPMTLSLSISLHVYVYSYIYLPVLSFCLSLSLSICFSVCRRTPMFLCFLTVHPTRGDVPVWQGVSKYWEFLGATHWKFTGSCALGALLNRFSNFSGLSRFAVQFGDAWPLGIPKSLCSGAKTEKHWPFPLFWWQKMLRSTWNFKAFIFGVLRPLAFARGLFHESEWLLRTTTTLQDFCCVSECCKRWSY